MNISEYLIQNCLKYNVKHVFGVPGDYILDFCEALTHTDESCDFINMCNELNAGYAADAYARLKGLGVALVTYGVGSLSLVNAVAGAYAENIPLLIISGAPAKKKLHSNSLLHHMVNGYDTHANIFSHITAKCYQVTDIRNAGKIIAEAFSLCHTSSKPVYLEIPEDLFFSELIPVAEKITTKPLDAEQTLSHEIIDLIASELTKSQYPLWIISKSSLKFISKKMIDDLINKTSSYFISFISDKGVISEQHNRFLGVWLGGGSNDNLKQYAKKADLIIHLDTELNELNAVDYEKIFSTKKTITINSNKIVYENKMFNVSSKALIQSLLKNSFPDKPPLNLEIEPYQSNVSKMITVDYFFSRLEGFLEEGDIVIADVGTCLFSALNMRLPKHAIFIAQSFYGSIGYSIPASLGASLAFRHRRVIVLVGDGALQVTLQALSSLIKFDCQPLIFVLNNNGYTIERIIKDGDFNNIQPWTYHKLLQNFGGKEGHLISNTSELNITLEAMKKKQNNMQLIEVITPKTDPGRVMRRIIKKSESRLEIAV